jgi:hypothetical protein
VTYFAPFCTACAPAAGGDNCRTISQNVYRYWSVWTEYYKPGVTLIDKLMHGLVQLERICDGRKPETTMLIIDSKRVKNVDTPEESGYGAGKNERHKAVYRRRCAWVVAYDVVTPADIDERSGALYMFAWNYNQPETLSKLPKVLIAGGFTGEHFAAGVHTLTGAELEVVKRSELHKFAVIPKRWVVERTFA